MILYQKFQTNFKCCRYAAGPLSGDAQSYLRSVLKDEKSKYSAKQGHLVC